MTSAITPDSILSHIKSVDISRTFNPYTQKCDVYDREDSPRLRSELLRSILVEASRLEIDAIWIGRDLGHRGGRRTGLALTDDVNFHQHLSRWGLSTERPTSGLPVSERTASIVWDMLRAIKEHIFLWNVFPFHPHNDESVFSNRAHNSKERREGEIVLDMLVSLLQPQKIVAVGNDAAKVARTCFPGLKTIHVRHPSYGGQKEFYRQIQDLYGITPALIQPKFI